MPDFKGLITHQTRQSRRQFLSRALMAAAGITAAGSTIYASSLLAAPQLGSPLICRGGSTARALQPHMTEGYSQTGGDADFLEKLGLLEGHMLIGYRLLEAGESRLAVPHFGHPIRELYTWLEPRLKERSAPEFEEELELMESWAEEGNKGVNGAFADAWARALPKITTARERIPEALRRSQRFMLDHVAMMLYDVASDYGESIERGRIVNVVEYHDSMGFLHYAEAVTSAELAKSGARAEWKEVKAIVESLRSTAYPALLPPSRLPMSVSAMRAHSDKVRAIAERVAS